MVIENTNHTFYHSRIGPRQANLVLIAYASSEGSGEPTRAVSPEPPLLAHISSESRGTFGQKARSLAPLNGWACAVKICHDGMLEDTNSLDGAQMNLDARIFCHNIAKVINFVDGKLQTINFMKNIAVFSEKTDVPHLPNQSMVAISVTLKIRSRSPKSNKLLILFDLYRLTNLVTFHPMVHEITCRQTFFGKLSLAVTLKIRSRSPKPIQLFIMSKCYIHANLVKIRQLVHEILCTKAPFGSNLAV